MLILGVEGNSKNLETYRLCLMLVWWSVLRVQDIWCLSSCVCIHAVQVWSWRVLSEGSAYRLFPDVLEITSCRIIILLLFFRL